jgi:5-methylcytosine-specific restriction endonuclease McrA
MMTISLSHLTDDALLAEAPRAVAHERRATAHVIALLMELDTRRLYLGAGYSSLFVYCTQALHLSEHATYGRIEAARAARRFPMILDLLADGSITLTTVTLLASELTHENHRAVLERARHKSKRDILLLVAALHPRPAVPSVVRKLPASRPVASAAGPESEELLSQGADAQAHAASSAPPAVLASPPTRPAVVAPLAPERYKIQFTVTRETYEKLRRVQDLLRHAIPAGDLGAIFDRALTVLMDDVARTKLAATDRPQRARPTARGSRLIPAAVKRAVWDRDGGRCAFVGTGGRRCAETGFLEFHHVVPYAAGGVATVENIQLRCAAHNKHEAECYYGPSQPLFVRESAPPRYGCDVNSVRTESSRARDVTLLPRRAGVASRVTEFMHDLTGGLASPVQLTTDGHRDTDAKLEGAIVY